MDGSHGLLGKRKLRVNLPEHKYPKGSINLSERRRAARGVLGKMTRSHLSNHKEYFAESTESYLGVNDFYPFVRAELKEYDPDMFSLMEMIWGSVE